MAARWKVPLVMLLGASMALTGCQADPDETAVDVGDEATGDEEGDAGDAGDAAISLTLEAATYIPDAGPLGETFTWWTEEVERRTDGRVQFNLHFSQALLPGTELRDGTADGRTDVSLGSPSTFHVEEFPLVDGLTLVPGVPNPVAFGNALHELYQSDASARSEYEDQGLVGLSWLPLLGMMGTPMQVEVPADLDGLDIRGNEGAGINTHLRLAGANPVSLPLLELYEALERGVVDGFWGLGIDVAQSLNMEEVSPFWTDPEIGVFATATIMIQRSRFEELPSDIQQILVEVGREAQDHYASLVEDITLAACDGLEDEGVTLYRIPDSDAVEEWRAEAREIQIETWQQLAEEQGVDAEEYYAQFESIYDAEDAAVDVVTVASCLD